MYHLNLQWSQYSLKHHLLVVHNCHLSMNWDSHPDVVFDYFIRLTIGCSLYFEGKQEYDLGEKADLKASVMRYVIALFHEEGTVSNYSLYSKRHFML